MCTGPRHPSRLPCQGGKVQGLATPWNFTAWVPHHGCLTGSCCLLQTRASPCSSWILHVFPKEDGVAEMVLEAILFPALLEETHMGGPRSHLRDAGPRHIFLSPLWAPRIEDLISLTGGAPAGCGSA